MLTSKRENGAPKRTATGAFLSPAGAMVVLICFFLPWATGSCAGIRRTVSGAQLGGFLWLIPVMAVAAIGVGSVAASRTQRRGTRRSIALSALIVIAAAIVELLTPLGTKRTALAGLVHADDISLTLKFGSYGSMVGLALWIVGLLFFRGGEAHGPETIPADECRDESLPGEQKTDLNRPVSCRT